MTMRPHPEGNLFKALVLLIALYAPASSAAPEKLEGQTLIVHEIAPLQGQGNEPLHVVERDGEQGAASDAGTSDPDSNAAASLASLFAGIESDSREMALTHSLLLNTLESYKPNAIDKYVTAGFALVGTLLGGLSTYLIQLRRLRFERDSARQAAGVRELSEIMRYRARQLNEFYAPMEALLRQGLHVRNEMYEQLLGASHPRVAFKKTVDEKSANGWSLWIEVKGEVARPFRLLHDLPLLKDNLSSQISTVGETVRINDLIVDVIHEKIGLVRHENTELSQLLGEFLAHQAVLVQVYKAPMGTRPPKYATVFPRRLRALLKEDADTLRNELGTWEAEVARWVKGAPHVG